MCRQGWQNGHMCFSTCLCVHFTWGCHLPITFDMTKSAKLKVCLSVIIFPPFHWTLTTEADPFDWAFCSLSKPTCFILFFSARLHFMIAGEHLPSLVSSFPRFCPASFASGMKLA
ncbi:hypothetical protein DUNSADRAFT_5219 [Dunaliella salina]|uniref:Encoded protein n=1 Tax=Dunaliella salina TaxID=3046 RepID=A0ABQ7GQW1_DUNSA|nr:hypothetical protein DUNSADRAFT_5219 [Dunaliella salina]|eukprot:KAF5836942.1 hypothetical protein DUNSADRAFT_5219 [Dunaliella salina]